MNSRRYSAAAILLALLLPELACSETSVTKTGGVDEEEETVVPPFSTDWGQWLSMAVMPDGRPAITFYDRDQGGIAFAIGTVTGSAVEWAFEPVDGYPDSSGLDAGDRGTYTSMVVADDGTVWAAFYDLGARVLRYAKRDPVLKAWRTGTADIGDGLEKDAGRFTSIALDASNNPVIVHHDESVGKLRIARWDGARFVGSVYDHGEASFTSSDTGSSEEERPADVGEFAQIKIIDGVEYIAYYDTANGNLKLGIGSDIHIVDEAGNVGQWPDFDVIDGQIHIMYQDVENQTLKYATGAPGSWTYTVVDDAPYTGADAALYFSSGKPQVVYFEGQSNNMKHAKTDTSEWSTRTIAEDGAVGFHNEVVTIGSTSYVACYDYTQRNVYFSVLD